MRILIVDDDAKRYERLVAEVSRIGINREQVHIVSCANAARDSLAASQFDLLILDVLLPLWPEDEPQSQHSLDLLFELNEGEEYFRPRRILGITADRTVADDVRSKFESWTWTVVEYSASNDEWLKRSLNCVRYILEEEKGNAAARPKNSIDLAIICALEKPELEEVLKLPWNWGTARPLDDVTFVHEGSISVEGRTLSVAAATAPRMGMVAAALRSAGVISILRPRLIAMCGICAGVKGKVRIGDVLFADPSWDFQSGKRVRDKKSSAFSIAPHQLSPAAVIRSHIEQVGADKDALAKLGIGFGSDAPGTSRVVIGPVASGSAVLADGRVIDEIQSQHRELIGVEMEIYGVFAAACGASNPQPRAFALKGVCDFADPDKEDRNQRYAAYASANVLRLLMERFGPRLLD